MAKEPSSAKVGFGVGYGFKIGEDMIRRRSLVLAALSANAASAFAVEPELTNFRFGIIRAVSDGVFDFETETTRIPKRLKDSGFRFGLGFDNVSCMPIEWYEIIRLPEATKDVTGNFQRSSASTLRTSAKASSQPSVVDDFWFDEGDPLGRHSIELYVNGMFRYKVAFEVVADR